MYSKYFHEWVCETYTPCGIVYATEVAKTILNKNHLSPSEFIRPFGDFTGKKILVPFGEKSNNEIKNFRIDTSRKNQIMQHLALKNNFIERGIIMVDEDPEDPSRLAYELNL